ncbi:MAG: hypothetical protein ACK6DC_00995 [Planctomycetota bacterium]|jgi:hypothetical protein
MPTWLHSLIATGGWLLTDSRQLDATLVLESIGISIPLSELYRNVQFDAVEQPR